MQSANNSASEKTMQESDTAKNKYDKKETDNESDDISK